MPKIHVCEPRTFEVVLQVTEDDGNWQGQYNVKVRAIEGTVSNVERKAPTLGQACELALTAALARVVGS